MVEYGQTGSVVSYVGVCHVDALDEIADVANVYSRFSDRVMLLHNVKDGSFAKLGNRLQFRKRIQRTRSERVGGSD